MRYRESLFSIVVAALLTLALTASVMAAGYDYLYHEDFEDQSAEGWVPKTSNNWRVQDDGDGYGYHQWNTNIRPLNPYLNEWSIYDRDIFKNMAYSLRIKTAEHMDNNPVVEFGILFHYQNANNFYYVSFSSKANETVLILRKNGQDKVLARCDAPILHDSKYRRYSVTTLNGEIKVTAQGTRIFQYYDTTFIEGKIGVGVLDDAAYFDNIIVCLEEETECAFFDNFNDANMGGWTALDQGNWRTNFNDYTYVLDLVGDFQPAKPHHIGALATIDNINAENFTFECELKSIEWTTNPTADLAVVWCYQDMKNYYLAVFHREAGGTEWLRFKNGEVLNLRTYQTPTLTDLEWHKVKITAENQYYKIFFDDVVIMERYDSALTSGKIGVGSRNNKGWFDNVCITCDNCVSERIAVTSPNGGEVLSAGEIHTVSWLSHGVSNNVALDYTADGGANWVSITSSTPNVNQYDWTVPGVDSYNCKVRVKDIDGHPVDASDNSFTIGSDGCRIAVTYPNGGENLTAGQTAAIKWRTSGLCDNVKIDYLCGGQTEEIIASTPNSGTYNWEIPEGTVCSDAKIRITCVSGSDCRDESDAAFTISDGGGGTILVLTPGCHVSWPVGTRHKISWLSSSTSTTAVTLEYKAGTNQNWTLIADNVPDTGCYDWTIPALSDETCQIKVSKTNDQTIFGTSTLFTVNTPLEPTLLVTDISGPSGFTKADIILSGNTDPFSAFGLNLQYDAAHLTFHSAEAGDLTQNWIQVNGSENTSGLVTIGGFNTSALPANSDGSIATITFEVTCTTCDECTQSHLQLSNLTDDAADMAAYCGTFSYGGACVLGDVNMDGSITPGDALCAYNIFLNNQQPEGDCDTECAMFAADANCDGTVTPGDALSIYNHFLSGEPLECPSAPLGKLATSPDIQIENITAMPGTHVTVPIILDNPAGLSSFGFEISYPSALLEFAGIKSTSLTDEWIELGANEYEAGHVLAGGYHTEKIISAKPAAVVELIFSVNEEQQGFGHIEILQSFDDLIFSDSRTGQVQTSVTEIVTDYELEQNYPNPFNMNTEITFAVPEQMHVTLDIYNMTGKKVRTLADAHYKMGRHKVSWNGRDESNIPVTSGVYVYRMRAGDKVFVKKLMLLK